MLDRVAAKFSASELDVLSGSAHPWNERHWTMKADQVTRDLRDLYNRHDDWNDGVLAFRALIPKLETLTDAEMTGFLEIMRLLHNLGPESPVGILSLKLRSINP
jgi:hypothetical protein